MTHGAFNVPAPHNEPVRGYAPGSPEKKTLKAELKRMAAEELDIPLVIGGEEIRTGDTEPLVMPHDRHKRLGDPVRPVRRPVGHDGRGAAHLVAAPRPFRC